MKVLRSILGVFALIVLGIALNLVIIRGGPLDPFVLVPFAVAVIAGILWLIMTVALMAGTTKKRRNLAGFNSVLASVIFLAICVVLYAMVRRWDREWDLTQEGRQALAPQTIQVLENLTQDVSVYVLYTPDGLPETDAMLKKTHLFFDRCKRYTPHLKTEFIDEQKEITRITAMNFTFVDVKGTIVVIRAGNRQKTISLTGPQPRLHERDFTNTLINVIQDKVPTVGFLTGHGERDLSKPDSAGIKNLLESEGYATKPVIIDISTGSIPDDIDVLVFNGFEGKEGGQLRPEELAALDTYVNSGGRLFVLIDPELSMAAKPVRRNLLAWLEERFGIVVGDDLLVSGIQGQRTGAISLMSDSGAVAMFGQFDLPDVAEFKGCYAQDNPITRGFNKRIDLLAARSVELADKLPNKVAGTVILRTLPYTYVETNLRALAQTGQIARDPDERTGSIGVGVAATLHTDVAIGDSGRTRDARVVVIGDSDFVTPEQVKNGGNLNLLLNSMAWLTEREELIAIRARGEENQPIKLTGGEESLVKWVSTLGVLNLVALAGVVVFVLRRKYQ